MPADAPGYRSAAYAAAAALAGFGTPEALGRTGGHVLRRAIPGSDRTDLAGPYPLFCCADWAALGPALADLPGDPVSLTLVADPHCPLSAAELGRHFDLCRVFHDHYLIDLTRPLAPGRHHRRKLRRPCRARLEAGPADPGLAAGWVALYGELARRKSITDMRAFTAQSLAAQLAVPGAHLVTAWAGERLIGADLYYLDGPVAIAHLSAYAAEGYAQSVSYPMIAAAAEYFAARAEVIDLGGAPSGPAGAGIADFKRGWTDVTRPSHLCGRVLDAEAYAALSRGRDRGAGYFPAYRSGEFAGGGADRSGRPEGPERPA